MPSLKRQAQDNPNKPVQISNKGQNILWKRVDENVPRGDVVCIEQVVTTDGEGSVTHQFFG